MKKILAMNALIMGLAAHSGITAESPVDDLAEAMVVVAQEKKVVKTPAQNLAAFKKMQARHKTDWFVMRNAEFAKKSTMMTNQVIAWAEQEAAFLQGVGYVENGQEKDELLSAQLQTSIAMYEAHNEQWKNYSQDVQKEVKALTERHAKELAEFKNSLQK